MTDHGYEAQKAAEAHLEACYEAMWEAEESDDYDVVSPSVGPFCGCNTCVVREVLSVGWGHLLRAARQETGELPDGEIS